MIQLIRGSIFNSKCDLIIIPCNNLGGVTRSIQKELMVNDMPYLHKGVLAGDVLFIPNTSIYSNASMIGYAASVDVNTHSSSDDILREIMRKIKSYCHEQSLQKVNIPLLGTGAGGGFLKDQRHILAAQRVVRNARLFLGLQLGCQIQQITDFRGGKVQQRQKIMPYEVHSKAPF